MAKLIIFLSLLVILIAVVFTFDSFKIYKLKLLDFMNEVGLSQQLAKVVNYVKQIINSLVKEKILTKEELAKYTDGTIYLAILGKVYDVTRGKRHYGKGGSYEGFAGRDGTRAFVTGEFTEKGLVEDIRGLTLPEFIGIHEWQQLYERDYKYVGKVIGEFYDEKGQPTETLQVFNKYLDEAYKEKQADADDMKMFPPCNSEYSEKQGKRLWCTEWSGGIKRDWVGVPRQYLKAGKTMARCACVKDIGAPSETPDSTKHKNRGDLDNPNIKLYPGCDPSATSCSFPN